MREDVENIYNERQEKFSKMLKRTIFELYEIILHDDEPSVILTVFVVFVRFLQILLFLFSNPLIDYWRSPNFSKAVVRSLEVVNFTTFIKNGDYKVYISGLYFIFMMNVFNCVIFVRLLRNINQRMAPSDTFVKIFKNFTFLTSTMFFIPLLDYQVSIFVCTGGFMRGKEFFFRNPSIHIKCLGGSHSPHVLIGFLSLLIFIPLNFSFIALYFEPLVKKKSYSNRDNSNSLIILQLYQIAGMFVFSAFTKKSDDMKLLLFLIIGSVVLLNTFSINNSFHSTRITKLWNWVAMENIWSVMCLCISYVLKLETTYIPFLWITGGIIFSIFTFTSDTFRESCFYTHINKIGYEREFSYHLDTLIRKIWLEKDKKKRDIDGYFHMHKMYCMDVNCPLKEDLSLFKDESLRFKNLNKNDVKEKAQLERIIKFVESCFKMGFYKFPTSSNLRIQYAYFLYEFMDNRQKSAEQLALAEENGGLSIQETFKIFRLNKFLEAGSVEATSSISHNINVYRKNNILLTFKKSLEKVAFIYNDFWNNLLQHTPEFSKIMKLGRVIQRETMTINQTSKYLEFNNPNDFKSLENLAKFWIYVTYEKEKGEKTLEKLKNNMNMFKRQEFRSMKISEKQNLGDIQVPILIMSAENEYFCNITNVNSSCAAMFGYVKNELLNKKVEILLPNEIRNHHPQWVNHYLDSGQSEYLNKERETIGQHKGGSLVSLSMYVKPLIQTQEKSLSFIAFFNLKKRFKFESWILAKFDDTLLGYSAGTPRMLQVSSDRLTMIKKMTTIVKNFNSFTKKMKNFPKFRTQIPTIWKDIESKKNMLKSGLFYPEIVIQDTTVSPKRSSMSPTDSHLRKSVSKILDSPIANIMVYPTLLKTKSKNLQYVILRLERLDEDRKNEASIISTPSPFHQGSNDLQGHQKSNFWFIYDEDSLGLTAGFNRKGELEEHRKLVAGKMWNAGLDQQEDVYLKRLIAKRTELEKEGIIAMKLHNNMIISVNNPYATDLMDDETPLGESESEANNPNPGADDDDQEENEGEDFNEDELNNFLSSRKNLEDIVDNQPKPKRLKFLRFFGNFLYFFIFTMTFFEFLYANEKSTSILQSLKHNKTTKKVINDYIDIANYFLDLISLERQEEAVINTPTSLPVYQRLKFSAYKLQQIKEIKSMVQFKIEEIKQSRTSLGSADIYSDLQDISISVNFMNIGEKNFTISEVSEQLIGKIIEKSKVMNSSLLEFDYQDETIFFIVFNTLNSFTKSLHGLVDLNYQKIKLENSLILKVFLALFLISIFYQIISQIILTKVVAYVGELSKTMLTIFLEIPEKQLKIYFDKTELYMLSLQQTEGLMHGSEDDEFEDLKGEESPMTIFGRKTKKFKYDNKRDLSNLIKMYFFGITVVSYCMSSYRISSDLGQRFDDLILQHQYTNDVEYRVNILMAGLRVMHVDPKIGLLGGTVKYNKKRRGVEDWIKGVLVLGGSVQIDVINDFSNQKKDILSTMDYGFNQSYEVFEKFVEANIGNMKINTYDYLDKYDHVVYDDLCSTLFEKNVSLDIIKARNNCSVYRQNVSSLGLSGGFSELFSEASWIYKLFGGSVSGVGKEGRKKAPGGFGGWMSPGYENFFEVSNLWRKSLSLGVRKISNDFDHNLQTIVESCLFLKFILFSIYLVLLIALYFVVWLPSYYRVSNDYEEALNIVKMMPPNSIKRVRKVRKMLKNLSRKIRIKT